MARRQAVQAVVLAKALPVPQAAQAAQQQVPVRPKVRLVQRSALALRVAAKARQAQLAERQQEQRFSCQVCCLVRPLPLSRCCTRRHSSR